MNWPVPVAVFSAILRPASAEGCRSEIQVELRRWTGWPALAAERFVLGPIEPLVIASLACVNELGTTAEARFVGGVAYHRTAARRVAGSWRPGGTDDMALFAAVPLRRWLAARDGDRVHLAVFDRDGWRQIPERGYHHMCG